MRSEPGNRQSRRRGTKAEAAVADEMALASEAGVTAVPVRFVRLSKPYAPASPGPKPSALPLHALRCFARFVARSARYFFASPTR